LPTTTLSKAAGPFFACKGSNFSFDGQRAMQNQTQLQKYAEGALKQQSLSSGQMQQPTSSGEFLAYFDPYRPHWLQEEDLCYTYLAESERWSADLDERIKFVLGAGSWATRFKRILTKNQKPLDAFEERLCKLIRDSCCECPFCYLPVAPRLLFRHFASHFKERAKGSPFYYCLPLMKSFPKGG